MTTDKFEFDTEKLFWGEDEEGYLDHLSDNGTIEEVMALLNLPNKSVAFIEAILDTLRLQLNNPTVFRNLVALYKDKERQK